MTTAALIEELQALGIELQPHGDALRFRPRDRVTPELLARMRDCKAELLAMLASGPQPGNSGNGDTTHAMTGETVVVSPTVPQDLPGDGPQDLQPDTDAGDWTERQTASGWIVERIDAAGLEIIDIPTPCPVCGGIVFWWDVADGQRCERCHPRTTGERLRRRAAELRRRYRKFQRGAAQ
jgi:hypothetical protein